MKVYILPVDRIFQPENQSFIYPKGNIDYGVEQDFLYFLQHNKQLVTNDKKIADYHYLPIYWTRWHLNHDYGKKGLSDLSSEVKFRLIDDRKTFTICQYDDGPLVKLGKTIIFLSSRKEKTGIDIPLLTNSHKRPILKPRKKYLASFVGRLETNIIRSEMERTIKDYPGILIKNGDYDESAFVKSILESYVALAPRGYGGSSFRFYEAMQLGVPPLLIGNIDTRPFKKFINWEACSFYTKRPDRIPKIISSYSKLDLLKMGENAKKVYDELIAYQRWCIFVLKELNDIKQT